MRAAVCRPSGVVEVLDVDKPTPGPNDVLVRVRAATIAAADYRLKSMPHFLRRMMSGQKRKEGVVLGMECSGIVEAVGASATRFRAGDEVFGGSGFKFGAHAEYVCVPADRLEPKPANVPLDDTAAIPFGGFTALCFLRMAKVGPGQNVLVYGASGSVGVFSVQLAKHFGARVTAVCSGPNVEMVKSLGADAVIDYSKEDFSKDGPIYDVVFDTVGKAGFSRSLRALKRGHPYVRISMSGGLGSLFPDQLKIWWISLTGTAKMIGGVTRAEPGDLALLRALIEADGLRTVIDRSYPLDQIAAAFRYCEAGHKRGHVLILP